jgi:hypothetical protein
MAKDKGAPTWVRGDTVRLRAEHGGTDNDRGWVDVFVPDSGWTVVVRWSRRPMCLAGPAEAFEPWEAPWRR